MSDRPQVLIIGGGVIGAACAYYLTLRDVPVTLIERGRVGYGCSYGNAGWIVPAHAMPLPMPGAVKLGLKWLCNPDSPLYIKPRMSWDLVKWLWRFMRHANQAHFNYAAPVLLHMARHSLQLFKKIDAEEDASMMRFNQKGILFAANSQAGLDGLLHEMHACNENGTPGRALSADELRAMEPSVTGPVVGGTYFPEDAWAEPLAVTQTLTKLAESRGATILPNTELFEFELDRGRITGIQTTHGRLTADQYVLATGSWTPPMARQFKLDVPIQAGKGYALIVDPFEPAPTRPIFFAERKVIITPRDGSYRLAGTMEIAGLTDTITPRRVRAILSGARQYMNVPETVKITEVWRGLRPCTPDGLPMIGRVPHCDNLILTAGHAMLGLTLATGTGELVADMITGAAPKTDPKPFDPARFLMR